MYPWCNICRSAKIYLLFFVFSDIFLINFYIISLKQTCKTLRQEKIFSLKLAIFLIHCSNVIKIQWFWGKKMILVAPWCSGYHYCTTSFIKAWTEVLRRFKSCSQRVGNSRWRGSLTMVPAGNKAPPFVGQTYHKNSSSLSSSKNIYIFSGLHLLHWFYNNSDR